jgi:hypothetical protein
MRFLYKKVGMQLQALLMRRWLMLYSASCKESVEYYDDGYDKQYPYDGAEVEEEKA